MSVGATLSLVAALTVAALAAMLVATPPARAAIVAAASLAVAVVACWRTRCAPPGRRAFQVMLSLGLLLIAGADAGHAAGLGAGGSVALSPGIQGAVGTGYLLLLAAGTYLISPSVRTHPGGAIDAALVATAATSATWMLALAPALERAGARSGERVDIFLMVLTLATVGGTALSMAINVSTPRSARPSLTLVIAALASALVGHAFETTLVDGTSAQAGWWGGAFRLLACGAAVAAMLHPSRLQLLAPGPARPARLSGRRLMVLAAAAVLAPAVGLAMGLAGRDADWLAGSLFTVVAVLLVLARLHLLARAHLTAEQRLRHLADHDDLTGLANRRTIERRLASMAAAAEAGTSVGGVLCFIDLDRFKEVNDTHGHAVGDALLAAVADRLASGARTMPGALAGRLGGDEFVIIAEGDPAVVTAPIVSQARAALRRPFDLPGATVRVTASIGVAVTEPRSHETLDTMLTRADHHMLAQKRTPGVEGAAQARHP